MFSRYVVEAPVELLVETLQKSCEDFARQWVTFAEDARRLVVETSVYCLARNQKSVRACCQVGLGGVESSARQSAAGSRAPEEIAPTPGSRPASSWLSRHFTCAGASGTHQGRVATPLSVFVSMPRPQKRGGGSTPEIAVAGPREKRKRENTTTLMYR